MEQTKPPSELDIKGIIIQALFLIAVAVLITSAYSSGQTNLSKMGLTNGFSFLERATGWSYSFSMIDHSTDDPYYRTLFSGFLNTFVLGITAIVFSTILGFAIGTARDAKNFAVQGSAAIFIQIFRNIPLILQLIFWYAVLIHLPSPRQAMGVYDIIFMSNRGVMIPTLNMSLYTWLIVVAIAIGAYFSINKFCKQKKPIKILAWVTIMAVSVLLLGNLFVPENEPLLSIPELKGLRFVGGVTLNIELVAMLIAIILYGSSYIAEVVRGGLQEVPKGLTEAGNSLGLSDRQIWFKIKMPMALRTILPPLGNQWIFLIKATTIGVAIGYSDLFMIISTSITQSGQTLELIGILMSAFLLINFSLARLINLLNKKLQLKGH